MCGLSSCILSWRCSDSCVNALGLGIATSGSDARTIDQGAVLERANNRKWGICQRKRDNLGGIRHGRGGRECEGGWRQECLRGEELWSAEWAEKEQNECSGRGALVESSIRKRLQVYHHISSWCLEGIFCSLKFGTWNFRALMDNPKRDCADLHHIYHPGSKSLLTSGVTYSSQQTASSGNEVSGMPCGRENWNRYIVFMLCDNQTPNDLLAYPIIESA